MKRVIGVALGLLAVPAGARDLDRTGQSVALIFEPGRYAEVSLAFGSPDVSGTAVPALGGFGSGDMAGSYGLLAGGYKQAFGANLDAGLVFDEPFGANVEYPAGTNYFAQGTVATLHSRALTGVLRYRLPQGFSILGGVRAQTLSAVATIPYVAGYNVVGGRDTAFGYLVGVAYEKPEIALRVALTYNSEITHKLDTIENVATLTDVRSVTEIKTPASVNLEAQTGIAKDTLLFGAVRWVDWTAFTIAPAAFTQVAGQPLIAFRDDTVTYSLGLGRKFTERWSGAVTVGYEKQQGGFATNLGPNDGYRSIGVGATYAVNNVKITGGVRYVDIGDADTTLTGTTAARFTDNSGYGVGVKVGVTF